ncbi:MAG TPA: DUF4190 domain-containing protein [Phycisphaerae bacterium]|nr:DUF4190 domain-containing protein [Phycisphaerae bacterium]HUX16713.1 DUF4190 domain-containing protein [Phycisphaerae bacterium]
MPKKETPGIAIASLVCGLASFVCLANVLTGIPAVITGHMALGRIKRSAGALGGRGLAFAGLILGYTSIVAMTVLLILIFALVLPAMKEEASKAECLANLMMIESACNQYAAEHDGRYPERLSELYPDYVSDLGVFGCPATGTKILTPDEIDAKTSYEYYGAALNASRSSANPRRRSSRVLACDKDGNHRSGKNIIHGDGYIAFEWKGGEAGGGDWDGD